MTHGSLFSGIGGFEWGAKYAGIETIWSCEIAKFQRKVLSKNFPNVKQYEDIRDVVFPKYADIVSGGFPCQDISIAGKGKGIKGERSGLWQLSLFEDSKPCYVTLPKRGIMLNGDVYQIRSLDSHTKEKGSILLPTPTKTNDKRGGYKDAEKLRAYLSKHQNCTVDILSLKGFTKCQILKLLESMMGFPIGATELVLSETP